MCCTRSQNDASKLTNTPYIHCHIIIDPSHPPVTGGGRTDRKQIVLCDYFSSKQLLLFAFVEYASHQKLNHLFLFFCFRSEQIQNLMREGGKKNIPPIFGEVNKKILDKFLERLMRATK